MTLLKEKNQYEAFTNFCLRTPLFPFSFYENITKKPHLSHDDFMALLQNDVLREAIYLASPELEAQLQKWEEGILTDQKKIDRLQSSLLKYASRISTRCTPFGLFASCASGTFADETKIQFNKEESHTRSTRFDMSFLSQLQLELLKDKNIRTDLLFYPNTSLYIVGDHFRYIEYTFKNKRREYSLEGFTWNEYINIILEKAKTGLRISELAKSILDEDINLEEATEFIENLINNQILVSELELTVTGEDYFKGLLNRIEGIPESEATLKWLKELDEQLLKIDAKVGNTTSSYQDLIELSKNTFSDFNTKYLLQTDSFSKLKTNTLNKDVIPQLKKAITLFSKISIPSSNQKINQFKTAFRKRFDDAEIGLNLVLDSEIGISYGDKKYDNSHFLNDIVVGYSSSNYQQIIWTSFDQLMQQKLFTASQNNDQTVTLTDKDLERFKNEWDSPDTFSALIEVIPDSENEKIYVSNTGGSSGAFLLGRFTNGDKGLFNHVQEILDFEDQSNPDKIIAEIVHLPEARTGNILQRANNRNYEISYLGNSSLDTSQQILIDDVMVSVKQNKVILRSKSLNKEIVPKLTNAHNFKGNPLPIYEFLCDLQNQEKTSGVGFYWNSIFLNHPYLPRVEYKNLILSKARWMITVSDFDVIFKNDDILAEIEKWRLKLKIPELVDFVERDNKLLINLKNKDSILMLYNTIKKRGSFILEEFLFKKDEKNNNGNDFFCNQYVVSFYKNNQEK
jgi:hypothetical protein